MNKIYYYVPKDFDTMYMPSFVISDNPNIVTYGFHISDIKGGDKIDDQFCQKGISEILENFWNVENMNRKQLIDFLDSIGFIYSDQLMIHSTNIIVSDIKEKNSH